MWKTLGALLCAVWLSGCGDDGPPPPIEPVCDPGCDGLATCELVDEVPTCVAPWDDVYGPPPPLDQRLAIFDDLWANLRAISPVFAVVPPRDWEAFVAEQRLRMEEARSYGEFYRILSRFFAELPDVHDVIFSERVCLGVGLDQRPPHAFLGADALSPFLGVCLTALDDGTALVYSAQPDNPAGLAPGDRILGYDGATLDELADELLDRPLCGAHASHVGARRHQLQKDAALNFHLRREMDLRRFGSSEVEHVATDVFLRAETPFFTCTAQLPVAGVEAPWEGVEDITTLPAMTWGRLAGTNVGYIYSYQWSGEAVPFEQALDELWDTDGIVFDGRTNLGGNYFLAVPALQQLLGEDVHGHFFVAARPDFDDVDVVAPYSVDLFDIEVDAATEYPGRLAILQGPDAGSTGDIVPYFLGLHPRSRRFGGPTAGSACNEYNWWPLWNPDPWLEDLMVLRTTCIALGDDFQPFAWHAAEPDEAVWLAPEDVVQGRDTVVEAALRWIEAP